MLHVVGCLGCSQMEHFFVCLLDCFVGSLFFLMKPFDACSLLFFVLAV